MGGLLKALSEVNDIYTLLGLVVLSIAYIITLLYNRKKYKKQSEDLINSFSKQNEKIIQKLEELKETRNTLDLQSSMDLINIISNKSMLKIMDGVRKIIDKNNIHSDERRNKIYSKIKNIVNSQYDDDMIVLSRIYYKNIRLSYYIVDIQRFELTDSIYNRLMEKNISDKDKLNDIMDYIKSKYHQAIQTAQLQISA
jgi:hypothetical protein